MYYILIILTKRERDFNAIVNIQMKLFQVLTEQYGIKYRVADIDFKFYHDTVVNAI